ncbi:MAG: hypothetical protein JXP34_12925 [Planctomycetes bacterium]|nr:hypothetical protein [Planctomycetota bacterium]
MRHAGWFILALGSAALVAPCAGCRGLLRSGPELPAGLAPVAPATEEVPPLPPSWALGLWIWEDGFTPDGLDPGGAPFRHNRRVIESLVFGLGERGIAADAVLIPHPWSRGFQDFTFFDGGEGYGYGYPDAAGMIDRLRRFDVRTVVAVSPNLLREAEGYPEPKASTFDPARDAGLLIRDVRANEAGIPIDFAGETIADIEGEPVFDPERFVYEDAVLCRWGRGGLLDWSHPEAPRAWRRWCRKLADMGVAGFWLIPGDEALGTFVREVDGKTRRSTNLYPGNTWKGRTCPVPCMTKREEYARWFYDECGRATRELIPEGAWISDPASGSAPHLPVAMVRGFAHEWGAAPAEEGRPAPAPGLREAVARVLDAALEGFLVIGCPAGGDVRGASDLPFDPDPKLFVRWAEWSALLPLMLVGGEGEHRPWNIPDIEASGRAYSATEIVGLFATIHRELRPYLESAAIEARAAGRSVIEPVAVAPGVPGPYFLGPDLLVQPILSEGEAVAIELPAGRWIDFFDETVADGPARIEREIPYDRFPLFIRDGAVLPLEIRSDRTGRGSAASATALTICIWPAIEREVPLLIPSAEGTGVGRILVRPADAGWEIVLPPLPRDVILRIRSAVRPAALRKDGDPMAFWLDPAGFATIRDGWTHDAGKGRVLARFSARAGATILLVPGAGDPENRGGVDGVDEGDHPGDAPAAAPAPGSPEARP